MNYREAFESFIQSLQGEICDALEKEDGHVSFISDVWEREGGGGGLTRVMSDGRVFEKAGVNTSAVHGTLSEQMQRHLKVRHGQFFACGLSLVIHPHNPFVPSVHANYRFFELYNEAGQVADRWFAGCSDLTPYYLEEEDARHFHQVKKQICDGIDPSLYPKYKEACDAYFYNHHRGEARGIGGVFFDYLRDGQPLPEAQAFALTTSLGQSFLDAYLPIVQKRKLLPYGDAERHWQEVRRGRYVEFNLLHDRGTLFGLKTNGRIESIFMSLPPRVRWEYDEEPDEGTTEARLLAVLRQPRNWTN